MIPRAPIPYEKRPPGSWVIARIVLYEVSGYVLRIMHGQKRCPTPFKGRAAAS